MRSPLVNLMVCLNLFSVLPPCSSFMNPQSPGKRPHTVHQHRGADVGRPYPLRSIGTPITSRSQAVPASTMQTQHRSSRLCSRNGRTCCLNRSMVFLRRILGISPEVKTFRRVAVLVRLDSCVSVLSPSCTRRSGGRRRWPRRPRPQRMPLPPYCRNRLNQSRLRQCEEEAGRSRRHRR